MNTILNKAYTHTAIVLGATPYEEHVKKLVLDNNWKVIFISNETSETFLLLDIVHTYNHTYHEMNFNSYEQWLGLLNRYKTIDLIIVDYSTAKFFNEQYNFINGKIFKLITDHMSIGARFFTYCCHNLLDGKIHKFGEEEVYIFNNRYFTYVQKDTDDMTEKEYLNKIKYYTPLNFELRVFKNVETYPIPINYIYKVKQKQKYIMLKKLSF